MKESDKRNTCTLSNCKYAMEHSKNEKCFLSVNSTYLILHLQFYFFFLSVSPFHSVSLCARFFRSLSWFLWFFVFFYLSNLLFNSYAHRAIEAGDWSHMKWNEEKITSRWLFIRTMEREYYSLAQYRIHHHQIHAA